MLKRYDLRWGVHIEYRERLYGQWLVSSGCEEWLCRYSCGTCFERSALEVVV